MNTLRPLGEQIRLRAVPPGEVVIKTLGMSRVAKHLGVSASTVWRWSKPRPKGTGGIVPGEYHVSLMRLAHQLGVPLTPDDLVLGRDE